MPPGADAISARTSSPSTAQTSSDHAMSMVVEPAVSNPLVRTISELRRDPLTGLRVIFAPEREARPKDFHQTETTHLEPDGCPFCAGHEDKTPPASLVIRDEDSEASDRWRVRVVANKFPAVSPIEGEDGQPEFNGTAPMTRGRKTAHYDLFQSRALTGGHEVIIESPDHISSLCALDADHVTDVFRAYANRIRYWQSVPGVEYVSVFKNVGAAAGASLLHSHSQLIATEIVPPHVSLVAQRAATHRANTGCCLQCDILRGELSDGRRIVAKSDHFVAYCPFAGRLPYLLRVVPRVHADRFESSSDEVIADLAQLTHRLAGWLERVHQPIAYNYTLHTRPLGVGSDECFHWWMELFPRMSRSAGFEWASECFINPMMPETAAAHLRDFARQSDPLQQRPRTIDFSS